jgi:hypothetical protein
MTERHIEERWVEILKLPAKKQRDAFEQLAKDVLDQISRARDVAEARTLAVALRKLYDA